MSETTGVIIKHIENNGNKVMMWDIAVQSLMHCLCGCCNRSDTTLALSEDGMGIITVTSSSTFPGITISDNDSVMDVPTS